MNDSRKIPITIGVTGHRSLREDELPDLRERVRQELIALKAQCPSSPFVLLTSLAEGADQLCAEEALALDFALCVALPMPLEEYQKDFRGEAFEKLQDLLEKADRTFVAPDTEPHCDGRDFRYRQAGLYVAAHSHVLIALWDGTEGSGGCGTADIVEARRQGTYREPAFAGLSPAKDSVIWILARRDHQRSDEPTVTRYGEEALRSLLRETEAFNAEAGRAAAESDRGGAEKPVSGTDPSKAGMNEAGTRAYNGNSPRPRHSVSPVGRVKNLYTAADRLSLVYAGLYRHTIAFMSVAATLITIAFLLYDEMSQHWMILICGLMLVGLFVINKTEKRLHSHKKYIEYRIFAEGLRVQSFLLDAGLHECVSGLLPWSWHMNVPWIPAAFEAAMTGALPKERRSVGPVWIDDQLHYHKSALAKTEKMVRRNERIMAAALALSVFSYIAALAFEIGFGGLLTGRIRLGYEQLEQGRTILKIVLGGLSAMTLCAGNYYGKLSLDETMDDHRRMIALYETAATKVLAGGESKDLLLKLAREELNENSSWYSYRSINTPDIGL